jgi:hypothetical protein
LRERCLNQHFEENQPWTIEDHPTNSVVLSVTWVQGKRTVLLAYIASSSSPNFGMATHKASELPHTASRFFSHCSKGANNQQLRVRETGNVFHVPNKNLRVHECCQGENGNLPRQRLQPPFFRKKTRVVSLPLMPLKRAPRAKWTEVCEFRM